MTRAHRTVRAWVLAVTAVLLGAASHTAAGGQLPHPLLLALASSLAALATLGLSQLKLPRTSLAAGVLAGQGLLHLLYSHDAAVLDTSGAEGHLHRLSLAPAQAHSHSPGMWLGHLLAAGATFIMLSYGEALLGALFLLLQHALKHLLPLARYRPLPARIRVPLPASARVPLLPLLPGAGRITRGPPPLLAPR